MPPLHLTSRAGEDRRLGAHEYDRLADQLRGTLLHPADPRYEPARRVWNGLIDRRPGLIIRCQGPADVSTAVRFAREHDLLTAVRGGGHNVAGRAVVDGGLVIDLGEMRIVELDGQRRRVTAQGGATIGDVDSTTAAAGLVVPLGVVSATGVAGLTLHGGYGWFLRRHGLSCDNLLGAEVVTADGKRLETSAERNPDLFWALRGGGGNFGVVTRLDYQAHPIPHPLYMVAVFYPARHGREVLSRFCEVMQQAPPELSALGVLWSAHPEPPFPTGPTPIPVAVVLACYCGPPEHAEELTRPLRTIVPPLVDLSGPRTLLELQRFFDPDYPDGRHYYWKSLYLDELSDPTIDELVRQAGSRPSPLTSLDTWALGGAVGGVDPAATAFVQRDARFLLALESNWDSARLTEENLAWTRQAHRALAVQARTETYLNFAGMGEGGEALVRAAYGANYARLQAIKRVHDPDNFFRQNFNIVP